MKILAITSCPNGIAHTYMAQEKLEQAAKEMGVEIKVETQGGVGTENALTAKEIREADGIIIAADRQVDLSRFDGKRLINENVREGIHKPKELIQRIIDQDARIYHDKNASNINNEKDKENKSGIQMVYQHLMNGVSFMVPFIVVGGLLIAIALTLGGKPTAQGLVIPDHSFWKSIENIGKLSFGFMVPILAAYIAYSIADKPGLVPGMIGGAIAADGSLYGSGSGAGFLGGIVAGFIAGYVAKWIKQIKVPKAMAPIMPIIIIPILASLVVGLIFIFIIGAPIASVFEALTSWLKGMQGANIIILAAIIGAMIAFDMGGPVNKVAFLFGSALIAEGNYAVMGMVAVAVCIPPIGLGLATFIQKRKFNKAEQEMGKASFTMGLFGITEGAIPFAAQDPLRIIPANSESINDMKNDNKTQNVGATPLTEKSLQNKNGNKKTEKEVKNKDVFNTNIIEIKHNQLTRDNAIDELISKLEENHYITSFDKVKKAILDREAESTTAIGMNVAIPHGKSDAVKQPVAVLQNKEGVEWESLDGSKPQIIFMIVVPNSSNNTHLKLLQRLSRTLMDDNIRNQLINAKEKDEIYNILKEI